MLNRNYNCSTTVVGKMEKKSSNVKTVLSETHPEVFTTAPRPGGYLKWVVPHQSKHLMLTSSSTSMIYNSLCTVRSKSTSDKNSSSSNTVCNKSAYNLIPTEYQLNYTLEGNNCEVQRRQINSETQVNDMLAATISCVMLMASEFSKIPEEHLDWTETYLTSIEDDDRNRPPNVQGILNHIRYLRQKPQLQKGLNSASYTCLPKNESDNLITRLRVKKSPTTGSYMQRPVTAGYLQNHSRMKNQHTL